MFSPWRAVLLVGVCVLLVPKSLAARSLTGDEFPRHSNDLRQINTQNSADVVPLNAVAINRGKALLQYPTSELSGAPWRSPFWVPRFSFSPMMARFFSNEDGLRNVVRRSGRFSRGASAGGEDGPNDDIIDVGGDTKAAMGSKGCFFKVCSFGTHNLQK